MLLPELVAIPADPPFFLGSTAMTNVCYAGFLETGRVAAPPWWNDLDFRSPRQPVVGVTWNEAMAYCIWLGESDGGRWRLPTEAEWELAASAGLPSPRTAWGDEIPAGELRGPWEVGLGTPNGYGLFDMGTIVHEWCFDWDDVPREPRRRASRGGSWRHRVRWSSPSARSSLPPDYRYSDYGFRVLKEIR